MYNPVLKPFIKWAGGKRQLLPQIKANLPKHFTRYIEPFVGGGALFFALKPQNAIINDINQELMLSYSLIKSDPRLITSALDHYQSKHNEDFYYYIRSQNIGNLSEIEIVARFIYLNKAGFNGLYRLNSKGEFNVPFGKKSSIILYDNDNITNIHNYLNQNNIQILCQDYTNIISLLTDNDFIFIDPPYDKLSSNSFAEYNKNVFTSDDQKKLSMHLSHLNQKNILWLMTNNNTPLIQELYKNFNSQLYTANRMINSDASKRLENIQEIFIMNYNINNHKSEEQFNNLITTMMKTNHTLDSFVNWSKISKNIREIEMNLHALNYLINKTDLNGAIEELFNHNKQCFNALPVIIARRNDESFAYYDASTQQTNMIDFRNIADVIYFINKTGLENFFKNSTVKNLFDYVYGVEVGLNSNARKNSVGKFMEAHLESIFKQHSIKFKSQVKLNELENDFEPFGEDLKTFDFVIYTTNKIYLIEVNFYNSQGSKLNETSRSYINLSQKIKQFPKYEFVWITDGSGWLGAKNKLKEAFFKIEHVYNLNNLENFINLIND